MSCLRTSSSLFLANFVFSITSIGYPSKAAHGLFTLKLWGSTSCPAFAIAVLVVFQNSAICSTTWNITTILYSWYFGTQVLLSRWGAWHRTMCLLATADYTDGSEHIPLEVPAHVGVKSHTPGNPQSLVIRQLSESGGGSSVARHYDMRIHRHKKHTLGNLSSRFEAASSKLGADWPLGGKCNRHLGCGIEMPAVRRRVLDSRLE